MAIITLEQFIKDNNIKEGFSATRVLDDGREQSGLLFKDNNGRDIFAIYGANLQDEFGPIDEIWHTCKDRIRFVHSRIQSDENGNEDKWRITFYKAKKKQQTNCIGILKWYADDEEKKYGVIECLKSERRDDYDVFLHHTDWIDNLPIASNDSLLLIFDCKEVKDRKQAVNCRYITVNDDWSNLENVLHRNTIDISDGRYGRNQVRLLDSLVLTLTKKHPENNRELFAQKLKESDINLPLNLQKICLINSLLPLSFFKQNFESIVANLTDEELCMAITNSDNENEYVLVVERRIKRNKVYEKVHKVIQAFKSLDIQEYLCDVLLSALPTVTPDNIDSLSEQASRIWKSRNTKLPISLLYKYPHVQLLIWYGGGKVPLNRDYLEKYIEANRWLLKHINETYYQRDPINLFPLFTIAQNRLKELCKAKNDDDFQAVVTWYEFLKYWQKTNTIKSTQNPIAILYLWIDDGIGELDMDFARHAFIFLKPIDQVRFVKRLIQKRALGDDDITLATLKNLVYADLDLYLDNAEINPNCVLDISTHVLVQLLERFSSTGAFMIESELFQAAFSRVTKRDHPFKLDHYFDRCPGRQQQAGVPRDNPSKTWYWFPRDYCDAPKANKIDENGNEYYWCGNARCYKPSIELHTTEQWRSFSLWDIIHILKLNTYYDEDSLYKRYITFIAQVNKFNQIAEKLKCRECGELLYPKLPIGLSNFHFYSVTRFYCLNESCSELNKEIYLNHCFHPNCIGIIDSRDSKQCENERYICPVDASCCTDYEFKKAVEHKRDSGGYLSNRLLECYNQHKGHNDKGMFYCYKCGAQLSTVTHGGIGLKEYKEKKQYTKVSYDHIPCRNGYQMPGFFFDTEFISLGKDLKNKSLDELRPILSELRVVEGNPYKTIVHFSSISQEVIYYCRNCSDVKYKAKPFERKSQNVDSEYKHIEYTLERIIL